MGFPFQCLQQGVVFTGMREAILESAVRNKHELQVECGGEKETLIFSHLGLPGQISAPLFLFFSKILFLFSGDALPLHTLFERGSFSRRKLFEIKEKSLLKATNTSHCSSAGRAADL